MNLRNKTNKELIELRESIENEPQNQLKDSFYLYTPAARKKIDKINLQIAHNIAKEREGRGNPVPVCGYSGRNKKKK